MTPGVSWARGFQLISDAYGADQDGDIPLGTHLTEIPSCGHLSSWHIWGHWSQQYHLEWGAGEGEQGEAQKLSSPPFPPGESPANTDFQP